MVAAFRTKNDTTPLVLMGYYNPIYHYGVDKFIATAKRAGVDGLIIVDLPPEEDDELCLPAMQGGLNFIRLATPTTDDKRLPEVLNNTSGFVYYVSITGITGAAARKNRQWPKILRASKTIRICRSVSVSAFARPNKRLQWRTVPMVWLSVQLLVDIIAETADNRADTVNQVLALASALAEGVNRN